MPTRPYLGNPPLVRQEPGGPHPKNQIKAAWDAAWAACFPNAAAPNWSAREYAQAKSLADRYTSENVLLAIQYVTEKWEQIAARYRLTGFPSIGLLLSPHPGNSLVAEASSGKVYGGPSSDKARRMRGEYDAESAARCPSVGWGDEDGDET